MSFYKIPLQKFLQKAEKLKLVGFTLLLAGLGIVIGTYYFQPQIQWKQVQAHLPGRGMVWVQMIDGPNVSELNAQLTFRIALGVAVSIIGLALLVLLVVAHKKSFKNG